MSTPRAVAALTGLTLTFAAVTIGAAQAADQDVSPTSHSQGSGQFSNQSGYAQPHSAAVTADGSQVFIGTTNGTYSRVVRFSPHPSVGFAADGWIGIFTSQSNLSSAFGVAIDKTGLIWTADQVSNAVSAFALSDIDGGDHAPELTIQGPNTTLNDPTDIAFLPNGNVVVSEDPASGTDRLLVFAKGRGGNIAPKAVIETGGGGPSGLAVDSKGQIYVAQAGLDTIQVYAAGATTGSTPIRTVSGDNTTLHTPMKLAIDSSDNLYVSNRNNGSIAGGTSVAVFAPGASGDATPLTRLAGASTTLDRPTGVALDANRNVYVVSATVSDNTLTKFAPLVPFVRPSAARSITVSGSSTSSSRTVKWKSPTSNGGTPVTKYRVVVKKGGTTLYDKTTTRLSYKLSRSKLKAGSNTVTITAVNKVGNAPGVKKSFSVKK